MEPAPQPDRPPWRIRPAEPGDVPAILELVHGLARYERELDAVEATEADFTAALFGPDPRVHAHVAEVRTAPGAGGGRADSDSDSDRRSGAHGGEGWEVAGIAVWFVTFSTWKGRHGLWLEDLFVVPEHRRLGLGRALLAELAGICAERGWPRLEWWVLDWNEPAHRFYESIGAIPEDEWTTWRLTGPALDALGGHPPPGP